MMDTRSDNWLVEIWLAIVSIITMSIGYLGSLAIKDRDKRIDTIDKWRQDHMKDHPNMDEILRMHYENRDESKAIRAATDNLAKEIHELILRGHSQRKDD